ncbi:MAG: hypothetical protein A2075_00030 [Geobacteraceae bacterium GWC2_58_44]|nr:MAG: hypothetical protein A2075_00030 [Geobacteraceae bacterium GWC2_58_44]
MTHPHASKALGFFDLNGNRHNVFDGATASFAARFDTADHGFINFNGTRQLFAFSIDHRYPEAMKHGPGDAVLRS